MVATSRDGLRRAPRWGPLFLAFALAVVALSASLGRSVIGTVGISLGALLAMPIMGLIRGMGVWMPTQLAGALEGHCPAGRSATRGGRSW
jgi:hypothetical protein